MYLSGPLINFDRFNDTEEIQKKAMASAAEGGPNSGFEIEGIEFFKDPKLTDEFPEMKDGIDLIISSESYIARLVDFRHRVIENKGMSRGMAHELLQLLPTLESFTTPSHFTEELSSVGAEMSLEAIDVKLWAIIGAAVAFVAALIYKFIRWLGFGGGSSSGDTDLNDVKKSVKESDKKINEQKSIIEDTMRLVKDNAGDYIEVMVPDYQDLEEIKKSSMPIPLQQAIIKSSKPLGSRLGEDLMQMKHYVKVKVSDVLADIEGGAHIYDYIRRPNKWARIIYNWRNPSLELILRSFEAFKSGSSLVLGNIELMEEIINDLEKLNALSDEQRTNGGQIGFNARINTKLQTMDLTMLDRGEFKVAGKSYKTPGHWALAVKEATANETDYRPMFDNLEDLLSSHDHALFRLAGVKFEGVVFFIEALQKAEPTLRRFEKIASQEEARERLTMNDLDRIRGERAQMLMRVASQSARNFNAMMTVYGIVSKVYEEASKHGTMIVSKLKDNAKKIVAFYNKYDEHPPPSLVEMVEKFEAQEAAYREAEIASRMIPKSAWISLRDLGPVRVSVHGDNDEELSSTYMSADEAQNSLNLLLSAGNKK